MQKTLKLKKFCLSCKSNQAVVLESNIIKDKIKCNVYRCVKCTFVYLDKKFIKNQKKNFYIDNYFHSYDKKFYKNKNNIYKKIFKIIKPHIKNKNVLEIGPGGGYMYYYLQKIVKNYEALEIGDKLRKELEKKYNIKVFNSFNKIKKKYDVIILISVLEHVKNPKNFLQKLKKYLSDKGKVIIEVPSVNDPLVSSYNLNYYKTKYFRKVHLHYFNHKTLENIVINSGLKVQKILTKQTYSFTNHMNWIYSKKGQKNSNEATNINLPVNLDNRFKKIFSKIDRIYKKELEKNNIGDIELAICKIKK